MKERKQHITRAVIAILLSISWTAVQAQPVLTLNRVINNWPSIELFYTVQCNGQPEYNLEKSHFSVMEDGVAVSDFTMWCPNVQDHCASTIGIVLQVGTGGAVDPHSKIIAAAKEFVSYMDGTTDEAALVYANLIASLPLQITTDKAALSQGIDNLPVAGASNIWDGVYLGLQEVILSGSNACRGIVVLSNGVDAGSTHSLGEIISLANRNRVKIYTVGVDAPDVTNLEELATQTGGKYFDSPDGSTMQYVYESLTNLIIEVPLECIITYQNSCADGTERTVTLSVNNVCGGSVSETLTYRAPQDVLDLRLDKITMALGETQRVPITAHTTDPRDVGPASFSIEYDPDLIESIVLSKAGTALENISTTESFANGVMNVSIDQQTRVSWNEVFVALDVTTKAASTVRNSQLLLVDWVNDEDPTCWEIETEDGRITVSGTTGIERAHSVLASSFTITPNPSNGVFEVALEFERPTAFSTRIVNALGQTVYERQVSGKRVSYRNSIQLADTPPGVYFFLIESAGTYDYRKLIVK